jgi:hypothetical protein
MSSSKEKKVVTGICYNLTGTPFSLVDRDNKLIVWVIDEKIYKPKAIPITEELRSHYHSIKLDLQEKGRSDVEFVFQGELKCFPTIYHLPKHVNPDDFRVKYLPPHRPPYFWVVDPIVAAVSPSRTDLLFLGDRLSNDVGIDYKYRQICTFHSF